MALRRFTLRGRSVGASGSTLRSFSWAVCGGVGLGAAAGSFAGGSLSGRRARRCVRSTDGRRSVAASGLMVRQLISRVRSLGAYVLMQRQLPSWGILSRRREGRRDSPIRVALCRGVWLHAAAAHLAGCTLCGRRALRWTLHFAAALRRGVGLDAAPGHFVGALRRGVGPDAATVRFAGGTL